MKLDVLAGVDGSAKIEIGNTKVLASVHGPHEAVGKPEVGILKCEFSQAAFSAGDRGKRGKTDRSSREAALVLKEALSQCVILERLPRAQVDVHVQVLQADGGVKAAALNAAILALASAGIPMRDIAAACYAGYLDQNACVDFTQMEENANQAMLLLAVQPNLENIVVLQVERKLGLDQVEQLVELAQQGSTTLALQMREALVMHVQVLAAKRGS